MKLKKLFFTFLSILFVLSSVKFTFAIEPSEELPVTITIKSEPAKDSSNSVQVTGRLPVVTIKDTEAVSKNIAAEVNAAIEKVYDNKVLAAERLRVQSLLFSYEYKKYNNIISIIINTTSTSSITKKEVDTINFHAGKGEFLTITDILGPNGLEIANSVIMEKVKRNPEIYNPDFQGIQDNHDFYVESGKLVILFDENEIAAASLGIQPFDIFIDSVKNYSITKSDYHTKTQSYGLKMIPLREICEAFGYTVVWNDSLHSVDILKNNRTAASLYIGSNIYSKGNESYTLESAPEILYSLTYVPISFFSEILGFEHITDAEGIITFSRYE